MTKKSLVVYKIIERLNEKVNQNQKLEKIATYIIQKLEEYVRSYSENSSWGLPD